MQPLLFPEGETAAVFVFMVRVAARDSPPHDALAHLGPVTQSGRGRPLLRQAGRPPHGVAVPGTGFKRTRELVSRNALSAVLIDCTDSWLSLKDANNKTAPLPDPV